ncbi:putative ATP-dependent RNA helicase TDRD12 [Phyllobates terribilis]|uniref:putative ATP-dependent RNA helicase TDRD12 n=1 Tax=Phyllobates terribilis TaxID=111132 RepID=UPI003CCAB5F1
MYSLAILQVQNPSCFFCEILKETVSKEYEQLFAELNFLYSMVYRDVEELKPASLPVGTFCVVFSEKRKSWCRAILESTTCSAQGELVDCFLLDFAVYCPIKKSNIRFPVKECQKLPFRARKFRLHQIRPVSLCIDVLHNKSEMRPAKSWDIAAVHYFRQLLNESLKIEARLCSVEDNCMAVDLYLTTKDSVICANDDLVAKKYACYENGKPIQRTENCKAVSSSAQMLQNRHSYIPLTEKYQEPPRVVSSPGQTLPQKCNSVNQEMDVAEKFPAQRREEDEKLIKEKRATDSQSEKPLVSFSEELQHSENIVVTFPLPKESESSSSAKNAARSPHPFLHPAWCKADPEQILHTVQEKPQTSENDAKVDSDPAQFMWPAWSNRDLRRRLSTGFLIHLAMVGLEADTVWAHQGSRKEKWNVGRLSGKYRRLTKGREDDVFLDVETTFGRKEDTGQKTTLSSWITRDHSEIAGKIKPPKITNPEHAIFVSKLLAPCSTMDDTSLCTEMKKVFVMENNVCGIKQGTMVRGFILHLFQRLIMCGYDEPNLTESYCWAPIAEGFDTLVICPDASNPLYYLPPLLTYLSYASMAYKLLPAKHGPHAVIVCPGWSKARSVYNLLMELSKCIRPLSPMLMLVGLKKDDVESIPFRKPCEVIVTTPQSLLRCLEHHGLLLLRLCHIVFDEADVLFFKSGAEMSEILQTYKKIVSVENREGTPQQIVAVGSKWIHDMHLLMQYTSTPRVVIARMEQAAVFANVQQIIQLCLDCDKMSVLLQCLDYTPVDAQKLVIYTKHDAEAELVHKAVQTASVYSLLLHSKLVHNFSHVLEQWKKSCSRRTVMVLVVTDDFAPLREITDATCIIHYSFPENVGVLSLRLFSLLDYIQCKIDQISMDEDDYSRAKSVLLMTEKHASYAIDLLRSFQQAQAKVPPELVALAQGLSHAQESKKRDQELCPHLKTLGYCYHNEYACPHRHHINPLLDLRSGAAAIPESDQYITVVPFCIADATRFLGRVVTKNDPYAKLAAGLNDYYQSPVNKVPAQKVERSHLYAINDGSDYHRVQVLSTKTMDSVSYAHVQYIDDGKTDEIPVHTLFLLPPAFQSVPPQFREFIVCRVKPIDGEDKWDPKVTRIIARSIRGKQHRAKVVLHLGGIYWLDPMVQVTPLSDLSSCVYDLNVRREILSTGLGADNPQHIVRLKALLEHSGSSSVSENSEEIENDEPPEKSTEDLRTSIAPCLEIADADNDCHEVVSVPHLSPHSDEEREQLKEIVGQSDAEATRTPLSASEEVENDEPPEKSSEDLIASIASCLGIADADTDCHKVVSVPHLSSHSEEVKEEREQLKEVDGQRAPQALRTPLSASLYPVMKWFEKDDTMILTVKMRQVTDPKCTFYSNRLVFSCNAGGNHYLADMDLYKDIVWDKSTCKVKNGEAVITIQKSKAEMWNRLLKYKHPNVSFDFDHLGDSEDDKDFWSGFSKAKKSYNVINEELFSSEYSDSESD